MLKNIFEKPYIKIAVILYFSSLLSASANAAEINKSTSFTLSVTIPPHVMISEDTLTTQAQDKTTSPHSTDQETVREKTLRNNQPVILETTTVK